MSQHGERVLGSDQTTMLDKAALRVPVNGYVMQLRTSEVTSVAAGMGDASSGSHAVRLVEALRHLPANDRAPTWELVVRRFGRDKELPRAAAEIGMDLTHASALLGAYVLSIAALSPPGPAPAETL